MEEARACLRWALALGFTSICSGTAGSDQTKDQGDMPVAGRIVATSTPFLYETNLERAAICTISGTVIGATGSKVLRS